MTRLQHLLVKLMEECNEVAQEASKACIFGLDEIYPKDPEKRTNWERINHEVKDLITVLSMIRWEHEEGIKMPESCEGVQKRISQKKAEKVEKHLKYSQNLSLTDNA